MIEIDIKKEHIDYAKKLYSFDNLNNSITKGKSQIYGAIGEIVVAEYYKTNNIPTKICGDYNYDLIINGQKVDIKTKRTTVPPQDHYNCSVTDYNPDQECDYYYFVRVMQDFSKAFLLGYVSKENFYKKATFNKKGEMDTDQFSYRCDCYNLKISELNIKKY